MNEKHDPNRLASVITTLAANQHQAWKVRLSTGDVIEGQLSPYSAESDHIRINPEPQNTPSIYVSLAHVVSLQAIDKRAK